jgi:hypothetical protein
MAYKVLGQTTSTAPSTAATIVNLITDPSFEGISKSVIDSYGALTSSTKSIPGTPWKVVASSAGSNQQLVRGSKLGVTAQSGSESLGIQQANSTSTNNVVRLGLGFKDNITYANMLSNNSVDISTAIPIIPSTTYYWGYNAYRTSTVFTALRFTVAVWDGSGALQNTYDINELNPTVNTWTSASSSFANPGITSTQQYATLYLKAETSAGSGSQAVLFDSMWFSTNSTYSSTFPNPYNTTAITAPFTDRGINFADTFNNSVSQQSYAAAMTDLYTVPAGSSAVVSTIVVNDLLRNSKALANSSWSDTSTPIRIAVVPSGQTLDKKHFIVFDAPMAANGTQTFTIGMTLAAGDKIKVSADSADVAFTAFGNES